MVVKRCKPSGGTKGRVAESYGGGGTSDVDINGTNAPSLEEGRRACLRLLVIFGMRQLRHKQAVIEMTRAMTRRAAIP